MTKKSHSKSEVKTTSEKPVFLSPLDLKEALMGLLGVKPKEEEKEENKKPSGKSQSS